MFNIAVESCIYHRHSSSLVLLSNTMCKARSRDSLSIITRILLNSIHRRLGLAILTPISLGQRLRKLQFHCLSPPPTGLHHLQEIDAHLRAKDRKEDSKD